MRYLLLLLSTFLLANEPKVTVEQLFSVKLTKVSKVHTSKSQKNYGYVKVDESRVYNVVPRYGGYVEVLYADTIYKYVKKGELLVKVYSPELFSAKEEYLASLKFNARVKNREMLQSAKEKLILLGIGAKEIRAIQKSMRVSKSTNIYAPRSGYIFKKTIGNLDAFRAKQRLFEIVDMSSVWVEAKIHQKELLELETLKSFEVSAVGVAQKFQAEKKLLYPSMKMDATTLTLRLSVKNEGNLLKEGMYVNINSSAKVEEYLTLPRTAVIRKNNSFYVFVAGEYEGEYEPTQVDVKALDVDTYIVLSGVQEGDEVVNHALFMMDSDAQINGLY